MSSAPGWETPTSRRRTPRWAWALAGLAAVVLVALLAGGPDDAGLPGLPVETVEEPAPRPRPTPGAREVADPSELWLRMPPAPVPLGAELPWVWTGGELVVWNGERVAAWAPDDNRWSVLAPAPEQWLGGWSATWTGAEVLHVGVRVDGTDLAPGLLGFAPGVEQWVERAGPPLSPRSEHAVAWDGQRLYVWGGRGLDGELHADSAAYEPATDQWAVLPPGPLTPRANATAVWLADAGELLVWGGSDGRAELVDGAAYRPADGTWRRIPDAPAGYRLLPALASDGRRNLYAWGLPAAGLHLRSGARYDAVADVWEPLPRLLAQERAGGVATLIDDDMLVVWGGLDRRLEGTRRDGFVLDLPSERWRQLPPAPIGAQSGIATTWVNTPSVQGLLVWGSEAGGAVYPGPVLADALLGLHQTPTPEE